jgi:hypothetical protein
VISVGISRPNHSRDRAVSHAPGATTTAPARKTRPSSVVTAAPPSVDATRATGVQGDARTPSVAA